MVKKEDGSMRLVSIASVLALLFVGGAASAQSLPGQRTQPAAQPSTPAAPVRDPEAIAALERMGAYLRTLQTFGVGGDIESEEVLDTGQTIQHTGTIDLIAQRPNRLRANLDSARKRRQYFFDGQTLTVWSPRQGYYATVAAPGTIIEMINLASERLDLVVPFADLFELGVDPQLIARITSGFLVGTEAIDDQRCVHYAFRQPNVDWEIWIREGDQPLPCKYRITSLEDPARPDYTVHLTWELQPQITAETFTFVAPDGADRIPLGIPAATASTRGARP